MSFDAEERSQYAGNKVYLYTWTRGAAVFRYAAADQDVVSDFQRYVANGVIQHGPIEQGGDPIRAGIEVTVESDHPVASLFRSIPPMDTVLLLIQEIHADDLTDRKPVWQGRITSVRWDSEAGEAVITHEPTYTSLQRMGLRRAYQRLCPLVTGGARCRLNLEAFALDTTVQELNGVSITLASIAGRPDGYFTGGFITYEISAGVIERRPVRSQVGTVLELSNFPVGLVVGGSLKAYPGDDHTAKTCAEKFGNIDNYGGFIYFPGKNPFNGTPIY